jgi:hypothetical protein
MFASRRPERAPFAPRQSPMRSHAARALAILTLVTGCSESDPEPPREPGDPSAELDGGPPPSGDASFEMAMESDAGRPSDADTGADGDGAVEGAGDATNMPAPSDAGGPPDAAPAPVPDAGADTQDGAIAMAGGEPWSARVCQEDGSPDHALETFTLTVEAEYVALRGAMASGTDTLAQRGEPCAGAADVGACMSALAQLEAAIPREPVVCTPDLGCPLSHYVVTTTRGEPRVWRTSEELVQLLAPIDSLAEAWYLAEVEGVQGPCGDLESAAQRNADAGYELRVLVTTSWCKPYEQARFTYHVTREGALEEVAREVVTSSPGGCVSAGR